MCPKAIEYVATRVTIIKTGISNGDAIKIKDSEIYNLNVFKNRVFINTYFTSQFKIASTGQFTSYNVNEKQ